MSSEILDANQLPSYDDEEIQLMDTEANNLQLEEEEEKPIVERKRNDRAAAADEDVDQPKERRKSSSFSIREKVKVYIRDGPKKHHVETIAYDDNYYDLPKAEQLETINLNEEKMKDIFTSLNLTEEDFKSSSTPFGLSRPESLLIRGVNNMSTQEILDYFEDFQPIGIAWISDQSCNIFWHETLTPLNLLAKISTIIESVPQRNSGKRKYSDLSFSESKSSETSIPSGHWRQIDFSSDDSTKKPVRFFVRYTTLDDRKARGAENHSEYYRQYGNPNYNNMTGLISRSKKRALNATRHNRYSDLTITKTNDEPTSAAFLDDETAPTTEENPADPNVKFTVVLPPKKETNVADQDEEEEEDRQTKRRRRTSNDDDDEAKTHFTVTIDPSTKQTKRLSDRLGENPKSSSNRYDDNDADDDRDEEPKVLDAREILERKRRNRK